MDVILFVIMKLIFGFFELIISRRRSNFHAKLRLRIRCDWNRDVRRIIRGVCRANGGQIQLLHLHRTRVAATRALLVVVVVTIIITTITERLALPPEEQEDRPHPEQPEPVVNRNVLA